jgi:hypothetical protein
MYIRYLCISHPLPLRQIFAPAYRHTKPENIFLGPVIQESVNFGLTKSSNNLPNDLFINKEIFFQKSCLDQSCAVPKILSWFRFRVFWNTTTSVRFGFGYFQKRRTVQMYELIYVCFEHFTK